VSGARLHWSVGPDAQPVPWWTLADSSWQVQATNWSGLDAVGQVARQDAGLEVAPRSLALLAAGPRLQMSVEGRRAW
jgi:hypothetical protein